MVNNNDVNLDALDRMKGLSDKDKLNEKLENLVKQKNKRCYIDNKQLQQLDLNKVKVLLASHNLWDDATKIQLIKCPDSPAPALNLKPGR